MSMCEHFDVLRVHTDKPAFWCCDCGALQMQIMGPWRFPEHATPDEKTPPPAPESSAIDHPKHYNFGTIEVIDAIEDWKLGFCLGNAVKYLARAGKKDAAKTVEDLKKARWYLEREIAALERSNNG